MGQSAEYNGTRQDLACAEACFMAFKVCSTTLLRLHTCSAIVKGCFSQLSSTISGLRLACGNRDSGMHEKIINETRVGMWHTADWVNKDCKIIKFITWLYDHVVSSPIWVSWAQQWLVWQWDWQRFVVSEKLADKHQ